MAGNRAKAEEFILEYIDALLPGSPNKDYYKAYFSKLTDKEFEKFMADLESGEEELSITVPNGSKLRLEVSRNLALAKKLGHEFFEKIWINNPKTGISNLSPIKFMVVDLPIRRQAQLLKKKIRIPKHNRAIDNLTGQPTGDSKGSTISFPETQIMAAAGLDHSVIEMIKVRGGDPKAFNAMNLSISRTGGFSIETIDKLGTKVKSTQSLRNILLSMHLKSTL